VLWNILCYLMMNLWGNVWLIYSLCSPSSLAFWNFKTLGFRCKS
jgi:hypothetical protein